MGDILIKKQQKDTKETEYEGVVYINVAGVMAVPDADFYKNGNETSDSILCRRMVTERILSRK